MHLDAGLAPARPRDRYVDARAGGRKQPPDPARRPAAQERPRSTRQDGGKFARAHGDGPVADGEDTCMDARQAAGDDAPADRMPIEAKLV